MEQATLLSIIKDEKKLQEVSVEDLQGLVRQYPYTPALQLLLAKKYQLEGQREFDRQLGKAALYAVSREKLYEIINGKIDLGEFAKRRSFSFDRLEGLNSPPDQTGAQTEEKSVSETGKPVVENLDIEKGNEKPENSQASAGDTTKEEKVEEDPPRESPQEAKTEETVQKKEETPPAEEKPARKEIPSFDETKRPGGEDDYMKTLEELRQKKAEYRKFLEDYGLKDKEKKENTAAPAEPSRTEPPPEPAEKETPPQESTPDIRSKEPATPEKVHDEAGQEQEETHSFTYWLHHLKQKPEEAKEEQPEPGPAEEKEELPAEKTEEAPGEALAESGKKELKEPDRDELESISQQAQLSIKADDELITETLARVYVMQRKYPKAIAVYEKLILKYPEKSGYFAEIVEELKNKL